MSDEQSSIMTSTQQYQLALSRWDNDGGAESDPAAVVNPAELQPEFHPLTNAELVQLRVRVIALENLVIALLAAGSDRQRTLARDKAAHIAPSADFTQHPLTIRAATQMVGLVERACRVRGDQVESAV